MKAVRIHAFGGSDQMKTEDVPIPEIKPGEALVKIRAAGINPLDWMIREKLYNPEGMDKLPLTLGEDFSGVIEKIHPDSKTSFHVGDAVFGQTQGSFAEYAVVPLQDLVALPRGINFTTGASIPIPALTAWQIIHKVAHASPGMAFLIHGASGGVGSFAVQFAKLKGAEVIATASRPSFEYLRSIGVDEIVDYETDRFEDSCSDVDVVIDPIGGEVQTRSWGVLKKGGTLINIIGEIDELAAQRRGVSAVEFSMEYDTRDLREIARLIEEGKVRPHISKIFQLDQASEALDLNQSGKSHGKVILKVA